MIWARPELRVLFVCSANVCRSPLAEGILRHRLAAAGLGARVQVRSAGSSAAQPGRRPDPRIARLAAQEGISLAGIRARRLTPALIRRSDYVLVMENTHLEEVTRLYTGDCKRPFQDINSDVKKSDKLTNRHASKNLPPQIFLLGSFLHLHQDTVQDIPDPYFGNLSNLYAVYELIDSALIGFLAVLEARLGIFRDS